MLKRILRNFAFSILAEELKRDYVPRSELGCRIQSTNDLVDKFAETMKIKLAAAEKKYGYTDEWKREGWASLCRKDMLHHLAKGDPTDVANYCAFMWYHKWSTTPQDGENDFLAAIFSKYRQHLPTRDSHEPLEGRIYPRDVALRFTDNSHAEAAFLHPKHIESTTVHRPFEYQVDNCGDKERQCTPCYTNQGECADKNWDGGQHNEPHRENNHSNRSEDNHHHNYSSNHSNYTETHSSSSSDNSSSIDSNNSSSSFD